MSSRTRQRVSALLGLGLAVAGLQLIATPTATAASSGLIINEVYGGGGSTSTSAAYKVDFVELYNPTGSPISLNGMSLQYRSGTYASGTVNPLVLPDQSVAPNSTYLVQTSPRVNCSGAVCGGAELPTPDFEATTTVLNMAAGSGQVILSSGTTGITTTGTSMHTVPGVVDFVGYGTATSSETNNTGTATANTTSVQRLTFVDGDNNRTDFGAPATPSPLNSNGNQNPLALAAVTAKTGNVNKPITGFSLSASGGTAPYTYSATGLPAGVNVNGSTGAVSGTPSEAGVFDVTAKVVDSAAPPAEKTQSFTLTVAAFAVTNPGAKSFTKDEAITPFTIAASGGTEPYEFAVTAGELPAGVNLDAGTGEISGTPTTQRAAADVTVTVTDADDATAATTFAVAVDALLPIAEIQGTGARSPFAPASGNSSGTTVVTTQGVVTGAYPTGGFNGLYIQSVGADTADASDAIFVYGGSTNANIPAGIAVGDSVRVTGPVAEFNNLTQIVPASASAVTKLGSSLGTITPKAVTYPTSDAAREVLEGELLAPTDQFTVSNSYSTNQYAEVGLATGSTPLKQMTEYVEPGDAAGIQAIKDENYQRAVVLDDGATTNFLGNQTTKALPVPWLTKADGTANAVRVGAEVTLNAPVILDWRNNVWKLQPQTQVTTNGADVATFEDTRALNEVPQNVGGDLKIATFNVLNYFNTTGEAYVAAGPQQNPPVATTCTYYTDRESNRIGNNTCGVRNPDNTVSANGPRGAATAASLARQEAKLTSTLLKLDAEVIGLEEVENSIKLPGETNRDDATARIVELLNAASAPGTWAYVKSPGESLTATTIAEQDVIRPAFIYQTAAVEPVGQSDILFGTTEFANAREPLAQAFKAKGAPDADAFGVIVNHFKSKGDNASPAPPATGDNAADDVTGVGAFNGDRTRQAQRLVTFADDFAAERGIDAIFLAGDFNSYTKEAPIKALEAGGFELIESDQPADESYSYNGLSGSLDHVLGNAAAMAMVTGADIWEINANESAAFQYSRYNYNVTDFWEPNKPFATSDHNPEIVGLDVPDFTPTTYKEIQVLGTNDFHGRLLPDAGNAAGAAPFATAIKELKQENPNSIFVAAGDLVGASTFESFIQDDEPTIDALNAMDLEVSAAGNHEFDRGYDDLAGRIRARADWEYIAANLDYDASIPSGDQLAETWTKTIDGVKIGFVGAVTEDLPALVNPAGIEGITVTDVVDATNAAAAQLRSGADPADLVVLLVHEGSPSTDCSSASFTDPAGTWGNIVQNTSADVDAIISGHTHLAYNCKFPVAAWETEERAVTKRPVVSAGQYGTNLNKLVFKYDEATGDLAAVSQDIVATAGVGYAADTEVQDIVDDAVAFADTAGSEVLGRMGGPFKRARYLPASGATENRGGESTLNNQVAEVQRWAVQQAGIDSDLAFMNPGGLRADMAGTVNGNARDLTYRQAADVQPFANTLVNLRLTGAQIEEVLEEQWQRNAQGGVPSRPFLKLGISKGFTYTYVETAETVSVPNSAPVSTFKGEVTGMWLNGKAIDPAATYGVTVNSFLGGGGDNFWTLAEGANKVDTGKVDLEAMVDYMARYQSTPLPVDYSQRGVEVKFPNAAPDAYAPGDTVAFTVGSWAMSADGDATDQQIDVRLGGTSIGTATLDNTIGTTPYDSYGTASVSVTLPASAADGSRRLRLVGASTGTSMVVPITVEDGDGVTDVQIVATNDFHGRLLADGTNAAGAAILSGAVKQLREENPNTVFAAAGDLIGASTFESFIQKDVPTIDALNEAGLEVSAAGNHEFDAGYEDLVGRVQDRADWEYIAANVEEPEGRDDLAETWTQTFGDVKVGFVGAVTEDLRSLVAPAGIEGITVTDVVDATNAAAATLKADGADLVVLLVHEGAPTTACASMTDPATTWGNIVTGVSTNVDAIVSGHTHLAYNCSFPVQAWVDGGRAVTERPVVSAGQYGTNLNKLVFSVDASGAVTAKTQAIVALTGNSGFTADPAVTAIVDDAKAKADVLGAEVLGQIASPFNRAQLSSGAENRGGESTLGNLVAEVQRWATESPESGSAQIAFMNPGGLRADMAGTVNGAARDLTYKQAAVVQPFANTLVNMKMKGSDIKTVLEQQWQRDAGGAVPSRPFLRLGVSEGFTYTFDKTKAEGSRITGMWLDGVAIDPTATYSVTVNSFLASGGDNFRGFTAGTAKADTGKVDLQAMVDYLAAETADAPLAVDYSQRAVGVTFPADAPASYGPGDHLRLDVSSWTMSTAADVKDTVVSVELDGEEIGEATLDNATGTAVFDDYGTAAVDVVVPADVEDGPAVLTLVGAATGTSTTVPVVLDDGVEDIQVLATNDFHGRIQNDAASAAAGAAVLSGAVKQLRQANPNTVFAAAGDLIGASTFESFIQNDKPTIDALNAAGLEVSAVGNHELDQGYEDLTERVMAAYDAEDNPEGGAEWQYIAANLKIKATGDPAVPATWVKTMNGVDVGFVGAVTEDLESLVSPDGIADLRVDPIVSSVNAAANDLVTTAGADVVVMLVHEGAPSTTCASMTDASTTWGKIVTGVNANVDAIVSGHTHLAYDCSFPVQAWVDAGRAVTERPVVSAGQYGSNLNRLVFTVDSTTGEVLAKTQSLLALKSCANATTCTNYPADPAVTPIVSDAVAEAEVLGARKLGELESAFNRAKLSNGTTENRGGESTLGNLVAEVQRWATRNPESGSAQIAFMNPGGLRADMTGTGTGAFPRDLTYKQAAVVQPFANTLVNMDLTGAQIEKVLEQQWQRDASGNVPSRPFLRLGISEGFTYTYYPYDDPAKADQKLGEVTGMWLDGEPIDPAATYSVTVNSFLASGGDNFRELANGTGKQDTGKVDLQAMVDYMAAAEGPVSADFTQRSVGVTFPANVPASYAPGDEVAFAASSLSFSTAADLKDTNVTVFLGETPLRTTAVTTTIGDAVYDEHGTAPVTFVVPAGTPAGPTTFRLVGNQTGTEVPVTVEVASVGTLTATGDSGTWTEDLAIDVAVTGNDGPGTGTVTVLDGETELGSTTLSAGEGTVTIPARTLEPGTHELTVAFDEAPYGELSDTVEVVVSKAASTLTAEDVSLTWGDSAEVEVTVDDASATGTVEVLDGETVVGSADLVEGVATVTLPAGSLEPGTTELAASYAGDDHFEGDDTTFDATVAKATTTVNAPNVSLVYGKAATVRVTVGGGATGTVQLKAGSRVLDSAPVSGGVAVLTLPARSLDPGRTTLTASYSGDSRIQPASTTLVATVAKAKSTTKVTAKPAKVVVKKGKVTITVVVSGPSGVKETGKVKITAPGGGTKTVTLKNGKATAPFTFSSTGKKTVKADYLGSDLLEKSSDTVAVTVTKK